MDGRDLPFALWPGPVRQNVCHWMIRSPIGLIDIEPILLEPSQIDDPEIGAARGVKRRRLAQVVPAGPDKLSSHKSVLILCRKFLVGTVRPAGEVDIVRADLASYAVLARIGRGRCPQAVRDRESVNPAARERSRRLAANDEFVGECL